MQDPDEWRDAKVHWHAYGGTGHPRDRPARLATPPDAVLCSPDEVVEWIAAHAREQMIRRPVRLLPLIPERWESLGDKTSIERDMDGDYLVASRGDSVYVDLPRTSDRWRLWVEAVTPDICAEVHDDQE